MWKNLFRTFQNMRKRFFRTFWAYMSQGLIFSLWGFNLEFSSKIWECFFWIQLYMYTIYFFYRLCVSNSAAFQKSLFCPFFLNQTLKKLWRFSIVNPCGLSAYKTVIDQRVRSEKDWSQSSFTYFSARFFIGFF